MITPKELVNRRNIEKQPVGFDYFLKNDEPHAFGTDSLHFHFERLVLDGLTWRVSLTMQPDEESQRRLYEAVFEAPKSNLPLEMICAIGLICIKHQMAGLAQGCSLLDFMIGETVKGM